MSVRFSDRAKGFSVVTPAELEELLDRAKAAPLRRSRICLHGGPEDSIHEMIIAFWRGSYVPPHRHPGKTESFYVIAGELDVVFFDDDGTVRDRIRLSATDVALPRMYRLQQPLWHLVLVRTETAIIHEVTNGPFNPTATDFAPWAPRQDETEKAQIFLNQILS